MTTTNVLVHDDEVRLPVRQAHDRRSEEVRLAKAANPPPGGWPKPAGIDEHNGLSTTAGGRGRDKRRVLVKIKVPTRL